MANARVAASRAKSRGKTSKTAQQKSKTRKDSVEKKTKQTGQNKTKQKKKSAPKKNTKTASRTTKTRKSKRISSFDPSNVDIATVETDFNRKSNDPDNISHLIPSSEPISEATETDAFEQSTSSSESSTNLSPEVPVTNVPTRIKESVEVVILKSKDGFVYKCKFCPYSVTTDTRDIKRHARTHFNKTTKPKLSDKLTAEWEEFAELVSEQDTKCGTCGKVFHTNHDYRQHVASHAAVEALLAAPAVKYGYKCGRCGVAVKYLDNLKRHWKNIHSVPYVKSENDRLLELLEESND